MRRNRIKAVINVPRSRPSSQKTVDEQHRPPTPITFTSQNSNSNSSHSHHHPASPSSSSIVLSSQQSPGRSQSPALSSISISSIPSPKPRYLSLPSPGGIFSPRSPEDIESYHQLQQQFRSQNSSTPTPPPPPPPTFFGGAFSSIHHASQHQHHHQQIHSPRPSIGRSPSPEKSAHMFHLGLVPSGEINKTTPTEAVVESQQQQQQVNSPAPPTLPPRDQAHSIVGNSVLLRKRLEKPSPSLTTTKYQTLRKEFMSKAAEAKKGDAPQERKELTMLHFAFWNPPKTEEQIKSKNESKTESTNAASVPSPTPPPSTPTAKASSGGPRVKVGPDGRLIIDEQSLVVETSESQRAKDKLSEMETVSGADYAVGSSGLFRNKKHCRRGHDWRIKETVKFYKALTMCGTDFSMMSAIFPGRSRAELKAKFKREDRKNPGQISAALACQEFDPNEEMTESEDEEEEDKKMDKKKGVIASAEDFVLGADGKEMKPKISRVRAKPRNRGPRKRPLTELERRLQDEMEEATAMYSAADSVPSSAGPIRPLKKRGPRGRPLTELERRLQEELEEVSAMFSSEAPATSTCSGSSSTLPGVGNKQPYFKNLLPFSRTAEGENAENNGTTAAKKLGGRPKPSWKSTVIVDDATGKALPPPSHLRRHPPHPHKKVKEAAGHFLKSIGLSSSSTDVAVPALLKAKRQPRPKRVKVEVPDSINKLKAPSSKKRKMTERKRANSNISTISITSKSSSCYSGVKVGNDESDCRSLECIPLLRFDDSDPLGLKVAPLLPPPVLPPPSAHKDPVLHHVTRSCRRLSKEEEKGLDLTTPNNRRKSREVKVKGLPFRVPGPGQGGLSSPAIVDEIEIEISCQ